MRDLRFYTTCKYQVSPVTVSEMLTEDKRLLDEKSRTLFMANLTMCTSFFQVFPALRSDGDNAEYSPARSCSHGGSYTGTDLPKLCQRRRHHLYYSVREKKSASVSQGYLLDKYPWRESWTNGVTRHVETKWKIVPQQNILVEPHYSQFGTWELTCRIFVQP